MRRQQVQEPLTEQLRERIVQESSQPVALLAPSEAILETLYVLWKEFRATEQRRDKLILLGWLALALLQTTACAACFGSGNPSALLWTFMVCVGLSSPIPLLIFLGRRRKTLQSCREEILNTADQASGQDCVGPLLDLMAAPGLRSTHFRLSAALARLLPRLTDDEARALTEAQRATLRRAVQRYGADTELRIVGLLVLGAAQDTRLTYFARSLHGDKDERLREAAEEYLRALMH